MQEAIDGTEEGRAIAKATREVAKRKHEELVKEPVTTHAKKKKKQRAPSTHQVAIPEGYDEAQQKLDPAIHGTLEEPFYKGTPAKQYPFELDTFQQTSVACLERRESVLVAAHTSAGKTVVAEYAIAMAFRDKQRVIYTSPLKALSNQKFRELSEEFGDVGLMTGDVSINPNANCIVMTTEILRSMIYRGSELLREVAWVIFDEVHYMQDRERGVVWEETIIFLDDDVKMVFLSATLSNAREFSQWVAHLHKQPCHVVYTEFRPTPLHHFLCPVASRGMYKILDEKGFKEENFKKMRAEFEAESEGGGAAAAAGTDGAGGGGKDIVKGRGDGGGRGRGRGRGGRGGRGEGGGRGDGRGGGRGDGGKPTYAQKMEAMTDHLIKLVGSLQCHKLEPIIIFSFSRRECEAYSLACANPDMGNLTFASSDEAEAIEGVYNNALLALSEEDRELPAMKNMLRMLKRGIGVHHSGLLPILKELIEILFQEGLIKVLFTTETFAMGLNMPARTVVFSNLKKFDGQTERYIGSGEYIQMSGRAGRRGKDDHGTVIVCVDESLDLDTCKGIVLDLLVEELSRMQDRHAPSVLQGKPSPLLSSFRLSYYTLLNLMKRVEGGTHDLEYVIANSFQQFQQEQAMPKMEAELKAIEAESEQLQLEGQAAIAEYRELRQQLADAQQCIAAAIQQPDRALAFLRPGRLIRVKEGQDDWGFGIVVSVLRKPGSNQSAANGTADSTAADPPADAAANYIIDTLLPCAPGSVREGQPRPAPLGLPVSSNSSSSKGDGSSSAADSNDKKGSNSSKRGKDAEKELQPELTVLPVALPLVVGISTLRVGLPDDLRPVEARQSLLCVLQDMAARYPAGLPLLDPVEDMCITGDEELAAAVGKVNSLEQQLVKNPVFKAERDSERFALYAKKAALDERAAELRAQLKGTLLTSFREESKSRMAVLRKLGHISADGTVQLKGRAACEIDTADELLTVELMFNGCFHGLDKHQLLALVSCLTPTDKTNEQVTLVTQLANPLKQLQDAARGIASISRDAGLEVDEEDYLGSFRPSLMDVFYNWSKGKSFAEVAAMTDIFEGSIIRVARRLDELMQQLAHAAKVIGDEGLEKRFIESNETLRRGIMFSASLYL